ncbi:Clp protease N-terminal domain-containing protein, partial [Streptomyces sp. NPDC002403]
PDLPAMREEDLGRHGTTHLPPIEDLARTIRQLARGRVGVNLADLTTHLRRTQDEIRNVLEANGITVKKVELSFGDERSRRLGVRVDALGGHGLAHLPAVEDLARTIRQLAAQHGRGVGVHLADLTTHLGGLQESEHLRLQEFEIRNVLEIAGVTVESLQLKFGDERRARPGVRVDALGGHGLAHLPPIEDIARTIRQLAAQRKRGTGVHLADLTTHLGGLQEFEIRNVLATNGINVQPLKLQFGDKQLTRLGVRVDDLGRHGAAHLPTIEDIARTVRQLVAANNHLGVHLAILAARLGLEEGMIRRVLAAHGVTVESLKLRSGGEWLKRLGVRVDALGRHGLAENGPGELPRDTSDQ